MVANRSESAAVDMDKVALLEKPLKEYDSKPPTKFQLIKKEAKSLSKIAFPIMLTNILWYLINLGTNILTGQLPKIEFDAASLSISTTGSFGIHLIGGFCTACDTIFSQTLGSGDKKRTGMWLQKSFLIINLFTTIIAAVHLNSEMIFLLLGQEPEIAKLAADFSIIFIPGLYSYGNYFIILRYLQNLDIIYPPVVMTFISATFNVLSQYICVYVLDWGYQAVPYCHTFSYFLLFFQIGLYVLVTKLYRDTWDGLKREALSSWKEFSVIAVCGAGQVASETMCFNTGVILAGTLNATALGAQNILYNIDTILYMVPYAFGIAVNIRAGQFMGNLNSRGALLTCRVATIIAVLTTTVFGIILISCRAYILRIFTKHSDIIEEASVSVPLISLIIIVDGVRAATDGVIRGCGRQAVGAAILFVSYYLIGMPTGIPLMLLTDLKLSGFWIGALVGATMSLLFSVIYLKCLNWEAEGQRAQKRVLMRDQAFPRTSRPTEKSSLLPKAEEPQRRYPREPRSCSTNFEFLTDNSIIPDVDFRKLITIRVGLLLGCLGFFMLSLILKLSVFPQFVDGYSSRNETMAFLPLINSSMIHNNTAP